ncbi:pectinesterase [Gracilibacillus caseinilyticus]|uniref:Pectinesterase n=1 Tax=Gracilibacillus caseinilyticus TaxID=2932256 RepID=A0ABY4EYJ3_9BACI|nr:pectinesterase [Gracilibacillus caseinilyticus]UOQ47246.1 pectinesterase [Gracilibacillus caseinilyticus]
MKRLFAITLYALVCFCAFYAISPVTQASTEETDQLAFPGAEGFGQYAKGGRGGEVYHVTSYDLTGPGTFHDALTTADDTPRTIVFDISGNITIPQIIVRNKANITIAGQTAPGAGVTIKGNNIRFIDSHDIVIRYMRFRLGKNDFQDDALYFEDSQNVIIDHSSFSWGTDENLSILSKNYEKPESKNITVQWSIISEGLLTHSMGGLIEMNTITMHHNLYAHNNDRNPKTKGQIDFVNNVVYNWGGYPYVAGGESATKGYGNVVGNYFVAGVNSANPEYAIVRGNENYSLFLHNNKIDSNKNGKLDGSNTGTDMMEEDRPSVIVENRFAYPLTNTENPDDAYQHVLDYAGSSLERDLTDQQVIYDVRNQTGAIIGHENDVGGYPELGSKTSNDDTDQDGMPDKWEMKHNLNYEDPADRNQDINGNGYTNLEDYLNELASSTFPKNYPTEPPVWNEKPFEPPEIDTEPETDPEPLPVLDGDILRNVVINDNSSNGDSNALNWSIEENLQTGNLVAGDRDSYRFTTIPQELLGVEWIRSAVNSRSASSEDLVSFYLAAEADVYVAHDSRISDKPDWLSSYEETGLSIKDDQPVTYELYKKHYASGEHAVLGPNNNSKRMNYFVLVKPTVTDETPPKEKPMELAAEVENKQVQLNWSNQTEADKYLIYRSSSMDPAYRAIASSDSTSYADNTVELGVTYQYKVSSINAAGESVLSEPEEILYFDANTAAPNKPADLSIKEVKSITAVLEWHEVEGAKSYKIYRSSNSSSNVEMIGYSNFPVYTDKSLEPSTSYSYQVSAIGVGGESEKSEVLTTETKEAIEFPAKPTSIKAENATTSSFELSWNAVQDAEQYDIYRKANEDSNYSMLAQTDTNSFFDDSISVSQTGYSYKIKAINELGESDFSEPLLIEMPLPQAASELRISKTGTDFVGLAWTANGGASKYNIYRKNGKEVVNLGYAKVNTFYDRSAEPGVHYTYFIKGENAAGESEASNRVSVTPGHDTVLKNRISQFKQSADMKGSASAELENSLKQAKHHLDKGSTKQAIKFLNKFVKQVDRGTKQDNISSFANSILTHYASSYLNELEKK